MIVMPPFALALQLGPAKTDKVAQVLAWLAKRQTDGKPDRRAHARVRPYRRRITLTTT
jgi:hypothetical protein